VNVGFHDRTTISLCFCSLYSTIIAFYFPTWYQSLSLLLCLLLFPEVSGGCFSVFRHDPIVFEHGGLVVVIVIVRGNVHSSYGLPCVR
jgi:hypothetical protein